MLYRLMAVTETLFTRKSAAPTLPAVPVVPVGVQPSRFHHYPEHSAYLTAILNARRAYVAGYDVA